ncbi:RDD family protein [Mucilaginibacter sp. BJC16-A38]|uniref:RDD family protein n=1 Tax=Mucilaginibacter phenanthrenivorans TaxID=1234842 RepID=UPI00215885A0|nr:RDD family protein [Mucilaginibacter phenanthrenivorans]MCR8558749.1 RDD family protein [Mucilaginibacter phenanthrenivorans]
MEHVYYILEDNEQLGPFSIDEVMQMDLDIHTRILSPLADTWQDACDLPEFYPYFEARGIYLPTGDNLASFAWRLVAWIIDYIILTIVLSFILSAMAERGIIHILKSYDDFVKAPRSELLLMQLVFGITLIIYNSVCEASSLQGSLGKKVCKLVVVDIDGQRLSFVNAFLRSFGKAISIFIVYLGFVSILFTEHRQALHDMLAKTYVVKL